MAQSYSLKELADLINGEILGDPEVHVSGMNAVEQASADEITFINSVKMIGHLAASNAAAVIVPKTVQNIELPCIKVENPDVAAAIIHNYFLRKPFHAEGILQPSSIGKDCTIPENVSIGPMACIGDRVKIGEKVKVYPGVVIGDDCIIGDESILHANVSIADHSIIGKRVILHAGVSIGSDGFGYATDATGRHYKKPQVGNVQIDDDVEIGANSCVDRGAFGTTRIRSGVKIDNLVMVAHNVDIGENTVLVAQVGISGSTMLGKNVLMGGKSGASGHINIGDRSVIAAMSGVHSNLQEGSVVGGHIAFDIRKWRRANASFAKLPDMLKDLRNLQKKVDQLILQLQQDNEGNDDQREE